MIPSFSAAEPSALNMARSAAYSQPLQGWTQRSLTIRGDGLSSESRKVLVKLYSFRKLNENWDSYNAAKPSERAIQRAIAFIYDLDRAGQVAFFVAPGPNGEIVVELNHEQRSIEVFFNEDGNSEYVVFNGAEAVHESDSVPNVYDVIAALR